MKLMKFDIGQLCIVVLSLLLLANLTNCVSYRSKVLKMENEVLNEDDLESDQPGTLVARKRNSIKYYAPPNHSSWKGYWSDVKIPKVNQNVAAKKGRVAEGNLPHGQTKSTNLNTKTSEFKSAYRYKPRLFRSKNDDIPQAITNNQISAMGNPDFKCDPNMLVKNIDSNYRIKRFYSNEMNSDNTIQFLAVGHMKTYVLKAFFKDSPNNCVLIDNYNQKGFKLNKLDCEKFQAINNRLIDPTSKKKIYADIEYPVCVEHNADSSGNSFFYEVFEVPKGENLFEKCIKQIIQDYDDTNSCIPYLRSVAIGALHGIYLMNKGNVFYMHGNLNLKNIYFFMSSTQIEVSFHNFANSLAIFSDITNKPEKKDLQDLGSSLHRMIAGAENIDFAKDSKSGYEIYSKTLKFFKQNGVSVDLTSSFLGVPPEIKSRSSRLASLEEFREKFEGSIFNLIYYLRSPEANSAQALLAKYITSISQLRLEDSPADY